MDNPRHCLDACKDQFMAAIALPAGQEFTDVCKELSRAGHSQDFWALYCCDSEYCGVWIDGNEGLGQSRKCLKRLPKLEKMLMALLCF